MTAAPSAPSTAGGTSRYITFSAHRQPLVCHILTSAGADMKRYACQVPLMKLPCPRSTADATTSSPVTAAATPASRARSASSPARSLASRTPR